jgi:hypothetical protein
MRRGSDVPGMRPAEDDADIYSASGAQESERTDNPEVVLVRPELRRVEKVAIG